eukprot:2914099-Alexandrium_andersonii.AAC.1
MSASLVGSEMCIRDRLFGSLMALSMASGPITIVVGNEQAVEWANELKEAVSYTHLTLPTICSV